MARDDFSLGPTAFTREEIKQARQGNYRLAEKRMKMGLAARARILAAVGKPHTDAELRHLRREGKGKV
jgi:hypothetical protein